MVLFSSTIVSLSPFLGGRAASWSSSSARWIFSFLWRPPTTSPAHFHQPRNPLSFCKYRWLCLDANPLLFFCKRQVPPGGLGPITKSPRWDFWWFGSCQRFQRVSWVVGGGVHCYIWPIAHSIVCVCVSSSFGTLHTESRTKRDRLNKRTRVEHVRPRIIFLTKKKWHDQSESTSSRQISVLLMHQVPPVGLAGTLGLGERVTWWCRGQNDSIQNLEAFVLCGMRDKLRPPDTPTPVVSHAESRWFVQKIPPVCAVFVEDPIQSQFL